MSINKSNVFFSAQPAQVKGGFVIDFRHAATGIVLDMVEALQLTDLPDNLELRGHPGLPGRAAWSCSLTILQVNMALRRAGYVASRAELANPPVVPPKPEPQSHRAGDGPFRVLAPGVVLDMSGIMPREYEHEPLDAREIVFGLKEQNGALHVSFGLVDPDHPDHFPEDINDELLEDALWEQVRTILTPSKRHTFICALDRGETIARLEALGMTFSPKVFLWYDPQDLSFGVSTDPDHDNGPGCYTIFIIPKDEDAPFYDDLRDSHLDEVPPYFAGNLCENTWALKPNTHRDAVLFDMITRGYTYDKDLDDTSGG